MERKFVEILIQVGESLVIDEKNLQLLMAIDGYYINYSVNWQADIKRFSDYDLVNVFRGMVLAENHFKWIGGSTAAGIILYKEIQDRGLDKELELANWSFHNTTNYYIPFGSAGTVRVKSKNVIEYVLNSQEYSHQLEIEKLTKKERILSQKINGLRNQLSQQSKVINDQKRKLELSGKVGVELADAIINDPDRSIYFFYDEIERLMADKSIDKKYLVEILSKFKTKERGKVKSLTIRLAEEINNRD